VPLLIGLYHPRHEKFFLVRLIPGYLTWLYLYLKVLEGVFSWSKSFNCHRSSLALELQHVVGIRRGISPLDQGVRLWHYFRFGSCFCDWYDLYHLGTQEVIATLFMEFRGASSGTAVLLSLGLTIPLSPASIAHISQIPK
jgi:hypothetical protein